MSSSILLATTVQWHEERMHIYDNTVRVPRLLARYAGGRGAAPSGARRSPLCAEQPLRRRARRAVRQGLGLCLYRDGRDSVAFHGDRIARESPRDTMVAIISLGAARPFGLKPKAGGPGAAAPDRPRAIPGDGRKLPANLAARHPQSGELSRRADRRSVPPALGRQPRPEQYRRSRPVGAAEKADSTSCLRLKPVLLR